MNFSNACRLKKGLSLILIVLMVVGMFSGCKKNNSETESNTTPSLNLNMSDTSAPTQETVPPTTTEPIVYNENMGTVTNQISVRVIPSKDANVTGTLDAGTVVEILRQETIAEITWGMISTPVSGWICMDYVKMYSSQNGSASSETDPNASQPTTPAETTNSGTTGGNKTQNIKGVISASNLNVRDEANKAGKPFLVEAPMENIVVPTPGCWNINDIYTPKANVVEGKVVRGADGKFTPPTHSKSHK